MAVNAPNGYPCPNGSNTARVQVGFSTSVKDLALENIKVYPNPFTQGLSIQAENISTNTVLAVKITDVLGRMHYAQSATISAHNQQLQTIGSTLPQGTYFIEIEDPSGKYFFS